MAKHTELAVKRGLVILAHAKKHGMWCQPLLVEHEGFPKANPYNQANDVVKDLYQVSSVSWTINKKFNVTINYVTEPSDEQVAIYKTMLEEHYRLPVHGVCEHMAKFLSQGARA